MPNAEACQSGFHQRWRQLQQAPVRALAWLLDSPDLLDADSQLWHAQLATLAPPSTLVTEWLHALDADPAPLAALLASKPRYRLGLYAEQLMAFYFARHDKLLAHGLQVHDERHATIGEFDFLLGDGSTGLTHIEFATKFYLYVPGAGQGLDALLGPNLADSLGRKMRKVFGQQLTLGAHPAAQAHLAFPVRQASGLIKGWLFYPHGRKVPIAGVSAHHCHGFWCSLTALDRLPDGNYVVLPKLQWLAPYRAHAQALTYSRQALAALLARQFVSDSAPVLVAQVQQHGDAWEEVARGFIVPDDWEQRAIARAAA